MNDIRERLFRFYRVYNPACLDSIETIVEIYQGREEDIFKVLEEKYGPEPPREHGTSSNPNVNTRDLVDNLSTALQNKTEEARELYNRLGGSHKELEDALADSKSANQELRIDNDSLHRQLSIMRTEMSQLRHLLAEKEATIDNLKGTITQQNDGELVMVREICLLQRQVQGQTGKTTDDELVQTCEQRYKELYEKRVKIIETEMKEFLSYAQGEIARRDTLIAQLK